LWLPERQAWHTQLIDALCQQHFVTIIKETPIIISDEKDIICWNPTPLGKCNIKSVVHAYRNCRN
jgi:hypothetical protein